MKIRGIAISLLVLLSFCKLYSQEIPYPDNITEGTCFGDPVKTIWDIEEKTAGDTNIHYLATIFAGDLDKDGRIEVVAPNAAGIAASNGILIFNCLRA